MTFLDQMTPQVHFQNFVCEKWQQAQIWISRTQLLIVIDLQYLPKNIGGEIFTNKIQMTSLSLKSPKSKMAANPTQ